MAADKSILALAETACAPWETAAGPRPLWRIAHDIRNAWGRPYFGAVPYLRAMFDLEEIGDAYGADDAKSIVLYFLSNATTWKGPDARRIKAELRAML